MSILTNLILNTDSYKLSHFSQYPPGTQNTFSYIESRGSNEFNPADTKVVHFGAQAYVRNVLSKPITRAEVDFAKTFCEKHGTPFNYEGWKLIVDEFNGYLPLSICSAPEGTPISCKNVVLTVTATDDRFGWLPSFIEPDLLHHVWYGSTVATISREIKRVIKRYLDLTSDTPDAELPFKLHDFGFRGVSSRESAGLGGAAHLVNFLGTDTIPGILYAMENYDADVCGYSIPASEHSTMTSWGRIHEFQAYKNMVKAYAKPGKIFACVIDSYDISNAIHLWANVQPGETSSLIDQVKEAGATVVLRPDSGDPVRTPIEVIEELITHVGYRINGRGYRVLPDHVRVIQGDGIDIEDVELILAKMKELGLSASNIAFGMGGGLLQKVNRDTFKFAMKCSAIMVNNEWRDVYKQPSLDPGKASKRGVLSLKKVDGEFVTYSPKTFKDYEDTVLDAIYFFAKGKSWFVGDSPIIKAIDFETVRENAAIS